MWVTRVRISINNLIEKLSDIIDPLHIWLPYDERHRMLSLQRNVVVLLPGPLALLVAQHGERPGDPPPCRMRHDHLVDVAALGRHERRHEAVLVFLGARRD